MGAHHVRSIASVIFSCLWLISPVSASGQSSGIDPYGNPLPSIEQQRQHLEEILGRQLNDHSPGQPESVVRAEETHDGTDKLDRARTQAPPPPTSEDLAETPDVKFTPGGLKQ
jgi:hypothetical protein